MTKLPANEKWDNNNFKKIFNISHVANHWKFNLFGMYHHLVLNCDKQVYKNYTAKLSQLHNSGCQKTINVLFLIRQNSKWSYQSLYEEFEHNPNFNPVVAVSVIKTKHFTGNEEKELQQNYDFFKSRGIKTIKVYENKSFLDLEQFHPDIVFYDQPWGLPIIHEPLRISQFALTAYCPYGVTLIESNIEYLKNFHNLLWRYFIEHKSLTAIYKQYDKHNHHNYITTGHPKFDIYLQKHHPQTEPYWRNPQKFKIIYAPHHSFENNSLRCATFAQNGKFILEWAKSHPETTWIFKPHPRFIEGVIRAKIMTAAEIDNYYQEWQKIGNIYTQGDYFNIFNSSDLMITDCLSFLAEYLPTGHPLIRLINPCSVKLNPWGEKLCSAYYSCHNNEELSDMLNTIAIRRQDTAMCARTQIIKENIPQSSVAHLITTHLTEQLSV